MQRLRSELRVQAILWRAERAGAYPAVLARGDPDAGVLMVLVETPDRAQTLYRQVRDGEGELIWQAEQRVAPDSFTDDLARARQRDPDVWVIEILDRQGRAFLEGV